jgi:subtilisin family serine protease
VPTEPNAAALSPIASARAGAIPGQYIVVLKDGVDAAAVADEHARSHGAAVFHHYHRALHGYAARLSSAALAAVEHDPRVRFVSEDREVVAASTCNASTFKPAVQCLPAGTDRIDADRSTTKAGDGRGSVNVNVAVLDSGIDPGHPDLNVVGGVGCTNQKGFDDQFGHGTGVAGIVAARDNGAGVVGVAPGARLWAVEVIDKKGTGHDSDIICGIDWVTSTRLDGDPSNDIAVANVSLEGAGSDDGDCGKTNHDPVHLAICNSTVAGITYVVAAGNDASDLANIFPAAYDEVLAVTAMADFDGTPGGAAASPPCQLGRLAGAVDDRVVSFSNFATLPSDRAHTVAAPGVCIFTTDINTPGPSGIAGYEYYTGTSQASPQVTGTVALCIASGACAGLTPAQIIRRITNDAAAYSAGHAAYGYAGDPIRPEPGKYYGFLVRAAAY